MSQLRSHSCCHLLSHFSVSQWRTLFFFLRKGTVGARPCVKRDRLETIEIIWLKLLNRESVSLHGEWLTPESLLHFFFLSHDCCRSVFLGQPRTRFQPENVCSTCVRKWIVRGGLRAWKKSAGSLQSASGEFQILISLSYIRSVQKEWALIGYILCCFDFKKCLSLRPRRLQPATLKHAS